MFEAITRFDFSVLDFIGERLRCTVLDFLMAAFSFLGEAGIIWIAICAVMLCFKKTRAMAVMALFAMAAGYLTGELLLKNIICRERPFVQSGIPPLISPPSGYSFPSGHSCSSFAAATVLLIKNKKLGIPAAALAFLIAFSRLYNYVHFPSDVIAGILLGVLWAVLTVYIFEKTKLGKRIERNVK